jgi:hypothetical protein
MEFMREVMTILRDIGANQPAVVRTLEIRVNR